MRSVDKSGATVGCIKQKLGIVDDGQIVTEPSDLFDHAPAEEQRRSTGNCKPAVSRAIIDNDDITYGALFVNRAPGARQKLFGIEVRMVRVKNPKGTAFVRGG